MVGGTGKSRHVVSAQLMSVQMCGDRVVLLAVVEGKAVQNHALAALLVLVGEYLGLGKESQ